MKDAICQVQGEKENLQRIYMDLLLTVFRRVYLQCLLRPRCSWHSGWHPRTPVTLMRCLKLPSPPPPFFLPRVRS